MITIRNPLPVAENGTPAVSLENIIKLTNHHGVLVGVLHRIEPQLDKPEDAPINVGDQIHATMLFFFDGYVHECDGLACGSTDPRARALKSALQMIPTMAFHVEGDYVPKMGTDPETADGLRRNKTVYFGFQPPFSTLPANFAGLKSCQGTELFTDSIKELVSDEQCKFNQDM